VAVLLKILRTGRLDVALCTWYVVGPLHVGIGATAGAWVGGSLAVGALDGAFFGALVGAIVGFSVGAFDAKYVGNSVGKRVGPDVGTGTAQQQRNVRRCAAGVSPRVVHVTRTGGERNERIGRPDHREYKRPELRRVSAGHLDPVRDAPPRCPQHPGRRVVIAVAPVPQED
jgi:hypothetical protein